MDQGGNVNHLLGLAKQAISPVDVRTVHSVDSVVRQ